MTFPLASFLGRFVNVPAHALPLFRVKVATVALPFIKATCTPECSVSESLHSFLTGISVVSLL